MKAVTKFLLQRWEKNCLVYVSNWIARKHKPGKNKLLLKLWKTTDWHNGLPHQYGKEQHEAWNSFAILLYGNIGSLDAADDTEDCSNRSSHMFIYITNYTWIELNLETSSYKNEHEVGIINSWGYKHFKHEKLRQHHILHV